MAAPTITIISFTRSRISDEPGADSCQAVFRSTQPLVNWEARADGNGVGQGDLVGGPAATRETWDGFNAVGYTWAALDTENRTWDTLTDIVNANADVSFTVDDEELRWGDKAYRINVYGKNAAGEWTPYG